jgi:hypothetical protein
MLGPARVCNPAFFLSFSLSCSVARTALDRILWEIAQMAEPTWQSTAAAVDATKSFHEPKLAIDPSLEGHYQHGLTAGELRDRAEWVQRAFSFHTAGQPQINRLRIHQAMAQFQQRPGDTGSTEVQGTRGAAVRPLPVCVCAQHHY